MRYKSRSYYEALLREPNVQRALSVIRKAEHSRSTTDPYRMAVTNQPIDDLSWHPEKAYVFNSRGDKSTAAGAYQFLKGTWNEIARAIGLKDFSPLSQDIAAVARIDWRGGLDNVLAGDFPGFVNAVKNEWASFPGNIYQNQGERSWAFMNRAWRSAGATLETAKNAGLYDTIFGSHSPTPNKITYRIDPGLNKAITGKAVFGPAKKQPAINADPSTVDGGLAMQLGSAPRAGTEGVQARPEIPVPTPSPRGPGVGMDEITRSIPATPLNVTPPAGIGFGMQPTNRQALEPDPEPSMVPGSDFARVAPPRSAAGGLLGSPEAFPSRRAMARQPAPIERDTPSDRYQHPAFSDALPKVDAFQHPPVPGLQPVSTFGPALQQGESGFDAERVEPGEFGYNAVPPGQLGDPPRSTTPRLARGLVPMVASALGGPLAGLAASGLMRHAERTAPGNFPDTPTERSGGLFGSLFSSDPVKGETSSVSDIVKSGPGSASYAGSGSHSIQGVMSSTGPGIANPSIGTVAASRSNPGFSVVGLGPVGYGRQSSKYGWTETVGPSGTSFNPNTAFEVTVDPATGRRSVSRVSLTTGKRSVIASTPGRRGTSRGFSFGPARGLASFFSGLFGPVATPAPALGPEVVSFAPGPTAGPHGYSTGGLGADSAGFGFGGLAGSFGPAGPAFGGGAHSNSTDAR